MSALRSAPRWHRGVRDGTGAPKKSLFAAMQKQSLANCACVRVVIPAITRFGPWGREMVLSVRKRAISRKVDGNVGKSTENVGRSTETAAGPAHPCAHRSHNRPYTAREGGCRTHSRAHRHHSDAGLPTHYRS